MCSDETGVSSDETGISSAVTGTMTLASILSDKMSVPISILPFPSEVSVLA